ncbi:DUF3100 domain-containing protein [Fusobacterium sp. PH5-44]|uniref:DUF3100 domain-containing protein n=1 Tax=unclassified Fusobacterium TaxID=2648384 RepID=UPI003D1C7135
MKKAFIKVVLATVALAFIAEKIGVIAIPIKGIKVTLLPMLYAVVLGLLITPDILGKVIKPLRKVIDLEEIQIAGELVGVALLILGVKYGAMAGPNIEKIISAGPAFIAQEFGHILAPIVALPLALILGLKREAVGATTSISREPSLGVIGEKYGINSPEGSGVLATYLIGTVLGTIIFGIIGSVAVYTGIHPYALGMACGVGSGSMTAAASAALQQAVSPEFKETVLAYATTSNMLSGITGVNFLIFVTLPLCNKMYAVLEPILGRKEGGK